MTALTVPYHATKLIGTPPCPIGVSRVGTPRTLTVYEHMNGTHFDGCAYGGGLAVGHTALNDLVRQIAIACGAAARVAEIRLGPKDPSRPMHPTTNANQKADGLFSNWTTSASTVVWDGTIVTAVPFHKKSLDQLASGTKYASDLAEIAKNGLKAKAAKACIYEFLPWAVLRPRYGPYFSRPVQPRLLSVVLGQSNPIQSVTHSSVPSPSAPIHHVLSSTSQRPGAVLRKEKWVWRLETCDDALCLGTAPHGCQSSWTSCKRSRLR